MYHKALECGISPKDFWEYSVAEVEDLIRTFWEKRKNDLKWKIMHDFVMAEVHTRFNFREEKQDIPHPWEYYPELFREEEQHYVKKKACDELESYKEARKEYAAEFNRRRRQGA